MLKTNELRFKQALVRETEIPTLLSTEEVLTLPQFGRLLVIDS